MVSSNVKDTQFVVDGKSIQSITAVLLKAKQPLVPIMQIQACRGGSAHL